MRSLKKRNVSSAKARAKPSGERERRISMEVVVDAYDANERAMGWYHYLDDRLRFPFTATCIAQRAISPLRVKDEVEVVGLPGEDESLHEMFVTIRWDRRDGLAVPLSQLRPGGDADEQTREAVEDWHYWVRMGYEF
jgi:hypothetical protein